MWLESTPITVGLPRTHSAEGILYIDKALASRNVLATLPFRNVMGSQATKMIPCTPVFITGGLPSAHQRFHKKSHNNERLAVPHSRESRGSSAPEVETPEGQPNKNHSTL